MLVTCSMADATPLPTKWEDLWEGPDQGLICAWRTGQELALKDPELARRAQAGELPPLVWKGGGTKALKGSKSRVGSIHYLATWQGLRSEDLCVDTERSAEIICSRFGVSVRFTGDTNTLLAQTMDEDNA